MSNVGILFEICFVPNCKIGIMEHLQVGLTAASQNYNDNSIFFDKYRLNKNSAGGQQSAKIRIRR